MTLEPRRGLPFPPRSPENVYRSTRRCLSCKEVLRIDEFAWSPHEPRFGGFARVCSECSGREYQAKTRDRYLRRTYGIGLDDYNRMLKAQNHACAICKKPGTKRLVVDHDHETGFVRGLLCGTCNSAVGMLRDDIGSAVGAAGYLHAAKHALP